MRRTPDSDSAAIDCGYEGAPCSIERAIYICNAMQVELAGKSYNTIRDSFERQFQKKLEDDGKQCFVFWTPEGEKAGHRPGILTRIEESPWYGTGYHQQLNKAILSVNEELHSHDFLRLLAVTTDSAKSRVFRLIACETFLKFIALYPETESSALDDCGANCDLEVDIPFPTGRGPTAFLDCLKAMGQTQEVLNEAVRAYTQEWVLTAPDISSTVNATHSSHSSIAPEEDQRLQELWKDSVEHFALMALFCRHNSFRSVTYYLSPLDNEELKSSMVIYWKHQEPCRSCHYLYQMLLGLNAAPILLHQEKNKIKQIALRNTGHLMLNRCSSIQVHLEAATGKSFSHYKSLLSNSISAESSISAYDEHIYHALAGAEGLSDLFQALQLWGFDSLEAVWNEYADYPDKRSRFFSETDTPLDLGAFLYCQAESIVERRQVEGHGDCLRTLRLLRSKRYTFWLKPGLHLAGDRGKDSYFRLSDTVLKAIFFEVFLNALRHGMINEDADELSRNRASVSIAFSSATINGLPALTLFNNVFLSDKGAKTKYEEQSEHFSEVNTSGGRGLGLIARGLSELQVGKLWTRRFDNDRGYFYEAAVNLRGLEIEELRDDNT